MRSKELCDGGIKKYWQREPIHGENKHCWAMNMVQMRPAEGAVNKD